MDRIFDLNNTEEVNDLFDLIAMQYEYTEGNTIEIEGSDQHKPVDIWKAAFTHVEPEKLQKLLKTVLNFDGEVLWEDQETPFGLELFTQLAASDIKQVSPFCDYILKTDLDHEVYQGSSVYSVIDAHGWCKETYSLLGKVMFQSAGVAESFPSYSLVEQLQKDDKAFVQMRGALQAGKRLFLKKIPSYEEYAKERYDEFVDEMKSAMTVETEEESDAAAIEEQIFSLLSDNDERVIQVMNENKSIVEKIDLHRFFLHKGHRSLEMVKTYVSIVGGKAVREDTERYYTILNNLYRDCEQNRETIDYLYHEGFLAYEVTKKGKRKDAILYFNPFKCYYDDNVNRGADDDVIAEVAAVFTELVERGANLNKVFRESGGVPFTPLTYVMRRAPYPVALVKLLIKLGADITSLRTKQGNVEFKESFISTIIDSLDMSSSNKRRNEKSAAMTDELLPVIQAAIDAGTPYKPQEGYNILGEALQANNPKLFAFIYDLGCFDVNGKDKFGRPLVLSAEKSPELLRKLLEAGAEIDSVDSSGETVLFSAAENADIEVVKVALEFGASTDIPNVDGVSLKSAMQKEYDYLAYDDWDNDRSKLLTIAEMIGIELNTEN